MRTGKEYREALRDGRRVWVIGDGMVDDVTTHPATRAMVDEYAAWYDRHLDPAWQAVVLAPADAHGVRVPWAFTVPTTTDHLRAMGRCFAATTFPTAGNITHTPAYGHLIALGVHDAVLQRKAAPEQGPNAAAYRETIARTGRFLTFCAGAATIGARLRENPAERLALRVVRETDAGLVISGKVGMHTSPAYAEDVYVGSHSGIDIGTHRASFIVPVSASGVTVVCRKVSVHHTNPFIAPLSSRFDELDGQMWLENVLIPWEHVFLTEMSPEPVAAWLFWHQLYCWLAKAEFTLGLALACADALALKEHEATIDYLIDLITDVQTVRTCQTAAELDPERSMEGYVIPNRLHVASGSIAMLKARQRMAEILRTLPGSSLVVAPADTDLAASEVGQGLEESFAGGAYSALQRSALLQLASDHVISSLDGRESTFELHANGGIPAWRGRMRRLFADYNGLANAVLRALPMAMPSIDFTAIREMPLAPRRPVAGPGKT